MNRFLLALPALLMLAAVPPVAAVITVDDAGGGDYDTIQEGLDAAAGGDTVLVIAGTYTGDGNRDLTFGTKNLVLRSESGAAATIIDGETENNHRIIDFSTGSQDTTCVVEEFTITNGRMVISGSDGAGIQCVSTSPRFLNCVFSNNTCSGQDGGAVSCVDASPVFRNCTFNENQASRGGVIFCDFTSRPKFFDSTFTDNSAGEDGGAASSLTTSRSWQAEQ